MGHIVDWDGEHLPAELRALPPGRYRLVLADEESELSPEQEAGLEEALASVEAGQHGVSLEDVRAELHAALKR